MGSVFDNDLICDVFGTDEVRCQFEASQLVQDWLDVERALAQAEANLGVIPTHAATTIARVADASLYDIPQLRREMAESQHPLVPLIRAMVLLAGDDGRYVHWGATTQDILDTATVLRIRGAAAPALRDIDDALSAAVVLAQKYRDTPMAGRTHGQHAVPITFGLKAAVWADELQRARERLAAALETASVGQLAGAAGTLASLGDDGCNVRRAFCELLGLADTEIPWHASRDRIRVVLEAMASVSTVAERIALEVWNLQRTELSEVFEPLVANHVGSSTMPQKRNPFSCEHIMACARILRPVAFALSSNPSMHERDMATWGVEWVAVPQVCILSASIASKLAYLLEGLTVDEDAMLRNLGCTKGLVMAEAVMMDLARAVGHEQAHRLVSNAASAAAETGTPFSEVLLDNEEITRHLCPDALSDVLDPTQHLGLSGSAVDEVVARRMMERRDSHR